MLLAENAGHFSMIRALHLADLITAMNCFCGFMSVLSSMRYCLGAPHELGAMWASLTFMPFGLFFDFFDGKVARWRKKSSLMGQELDSLADLVRASMGPLGNLLTTWSAGIFWCGTCICVFCTGAAFNTRHPGVVILRAMRPNEAGSIQCHRFRATKGRHGQEQVLRRIPNPNFAVARGRHGIFTVPGLDLGRGARRRLESGHSARDPSHCGHLLLVGLHDDQPDDTHSEAVRET